MTDTAFVRWFEDLSSADVPEAGGKGANLGELARAGFPVPPGFVITASAYLHAMESGGIRDELAAAFAAASAGDAAAVGAAGSAMRARVEECEIPEALRTAILEAYHRLGDDVPVDPIVVTKASLAGPAD